MAVQFDDIYFPGWEVVRKLGQGSFGGVYEIQRTLPDGQVEKAALKKLSVPRDSGEIEEFRSQSFSTESITEHYKDQMSDLVREYSLMQELSSCKNIVACHDVQYTRQSNGIGWDVYIRMELLKPLKQVLPVNYSEITVLKLGLSLCSALQACQKYNIIHRDIKPENILVSSDGVFKLGDFGIAKISEKTTVGTLTGTAGYMAPEVANRWNYGPASDIYSLGMVLYWAMNERTLPFLPLPPQIPTGLQRQDAIDRRYAGEIFPPPIHGSKELKKIIMKACAFSVEDRYQTVQEFRCDLAACCRGKRQVPIPANRPQEQRQLVSAPWQEEKSNQLRRSPVGRMLLPIGVGVGVLILLGALAVKTFFMRRKPEQMTSVETVQQTDVVTAKDEGTETTISSARACERIELDENIPALSMIGQTYQIKARKIPENADGAIQYDSENPAVAEVSEDGLVTAVQAGETNILISCGEVTVQYSVTVGKKASQETEPSEMELEKSPEDIYGHTDPEVEQLVQTGYLGVYTDLTIEEIVDNHDGTRNDAVWSSGWNTYGQKVVQACCMEDGEKSRIYQFTMLDESCFYVEVFLRGSDGVWRGVTSVMKQAYLNHDYYLAYSEVNAFSSDEERCKLLEKMWVVQARLAEYGASKEYVGNRSDLSMQWGGEDYGYNAVTLMDQSGVENVQFFLDAVQILYVRKDIGALNIRSEPKSGSTIVGKLLEGEKTTVFEEQVIDNERWGRTSQGWVDMKYLEEAGDLQLQDIQMKVHVKQQSGGLNIRSGPNTGDNQVGRLAAGQTVTVVKLCVINGTTWGYIDQTGWICMEYVEQED